jgi:hypothetical protein
MLPPLIYFILEKEREIVAKSRKKKEGESRGNF